MAEQKKTDQPYKTPDGDLVVRTEGRDFRVEGNNVDGYIGVSPEYRTYANETEKPFLSQGDVDLLVSSGLPTDVEAMTAANAAKSPRGESEDSEEVAGEGDRPEKPAKPVESTSDDKTEAGKAAAAAKAKAVQTPSR